MGKLITNAVIVVDSEGGGSGGGSSSYSGMGYSLTLRHNVPPPAGFMVTYSGGSLDEDMPWSINNGELSGYLSDDAIYDSNGNILQCIENVSSITFGPIENESYGYVGYTMSGASFSLDTSGQTATITLTDDLVITHAESMCLTGDTRITLADGTEKRIDQLTKSDRVLAYDSKTMQLVPDEIVYTDTDKDKRHTEYDVWTFEGGYILKTVHRHRLFNKERGAMVYLDEWSPGEHALTLTGNYVALLSRETIRKETRHYTVFTKNQNYFANGLLSGNRHTKKLVFGEG